MGARRKWHVGEKLHDIDLGNDFLDKTPKVQAAKAKSNRQGYIKLKSSCVEKETINTGKGNQCKGRKYL